MTEGKPAAHRALAVLHDYAPPRRPSVTYAYLALSFLITVPTLVHPGLYDVLGGIEPRRYPWQPFTAIFEHGWPGFHGSIHLALNAFLMLECGRPCERLLGWRRFLLLSCASAVANAVAVSLTEGVNGSSLVIWSWGPSLYLALRWARSHDGAVTRTSSYERIQIVLVIMYIIVTAVLGFLPYLYGWRGNPLLGLIRGNLFHLVATGVGIGFALAQRGHIERRLARLAA